jgi:peptide/nickel transport system permease protein
MTSLQQPVVPDQRQGTDAPTPTPDSRTMLAVHDDIHEPVFTLGQQFRRNRMARYLILNPLNLFGLLIIVVFVGLALFGPAIAPYSPTAADFLSMTSAPSAMHWFGTDSTGYDIFSRILAGARLSIGAAAAILVIAVAIGLPLGAISGLAGGWVDEVIMRITDMFLAFPALILALAIAQSMGNGLFNAVIALSVGFWPWYARLLRGQVLSLKHKEYVEAARAIGVSNTGIMMRHILPNALGPIVVELSQDMGFAILEVSALSFIGLGAQKPSPEWGAMINASLDSFRTAWWTCAFPGMAITLVVLGFNVAGDGLRDALDPRAAGGVG